jgi:hypothetical protein
VRGGERSVQFVGNTAHERSHDFPGCGLGSLMFDVDASVGSTRIPRWRLLSVRCSGGGRRDQVCGALCYLTRSGSVRPQGARRMQPRRAPDLHVTTRSGQPRLSCADPDRAVSSGAWIAANASRGFGLSNKSEPSTRIFCASRRPLGTSNRGRPRSECPGCNLRDVTGCQ